MNKKTKLLYISAFISMFASIGFASLKVANASTSLQSYKGYNSYEDIIKNMTLYEEYYGKEFISANAFFDSDYKVNSYIEVFYPCTLYNGVNEIYFAISDVIGNKEQYLKELNQTGKINVYTNKKQYKLYTDDKSITKLFYTDASNSSLYKLDLSFLEKDETINNLSISYNSDSALNSIYNEALQAILYEDYNGDVPDSEFNRYNSMVGTKKKDSIKPSVLIGMGDDDYVAQYEIEKYKNNGSLNYAGDYHGFIFDTLTYDNTDFYKLKGLSTDTNSNLYIEVLSTSKYKGKEETNPTTLNSIVIDNANYTLTKTQDDYYLVDNFKVNKLGQHEFLINSFTYSNKYVTNLKTNLNEKFTYNTVKRYHQTSATVLMDVDDPMIGYTKTKAFISLFNKEQGRLKNVINMNIKGTYYGETKNSKENVEFNNKYSVNQDNKFIDENPKYPGELRKLRDDERSIDTFRQRASGWDNFLARLGNITGSKMDFDYEFRIKGYLKNDALKICLAEYYTEAGEINYASMYTNSLNWDENGTVYNGMGQIQSNLIFNGQNIIDVTTSKVIEPEMNTCFSRIPPQPYEDLKTAFEETTDNVKDGFNSFMDKLKNNSKKIIGIASIVLGVFIIVLIIKFIKWIIK